MSIGSVISCGKASLHECQEFYSLQDVYELLEIANVDSRNQAIMHKKMTKE